MPRDGAQPANDPERSATSVPRISVLRRVRLHTISDRFRTEIFENFRGREILRSKSREIAPKSMSLRAARHAHDPQRSPTSVPSVGMLQRVRLRAISDRKFRKFCAAVKLCVRNRARSRRNPCRLVVHSLLTSLTGPQHMCRASACCSA